jgi:hypothetical protein
MPFRRLMTTDDLARWKLCGIPSTWRIPTARHPGGSPRRNRCLARLALPPGCRVVALGEVVGMPHPVHTGLAPPALVAGHPGDLPARRGHVWLGRAAFAEVARLRGRQPRPWWSKRSVTCWNVG